MVGHPRVSIAIGTELTPESKALHGNRHVGVLGCALLPTKMGAVGAVATPFADNGSCGAW